MCVVIAIWDITGINMIVVLKHIVGNYSLCLMKFARVGIKMGWLDHMRCRKMVAEFRN